MASDKTNNENKQYSESYLIEKERQKTRRSRNKMIFFALIIIVALFVLYLIVGQGGKGVQRRRIAQRIAHTVLMSARQKSPTGSHEEPKS